MISIENQRNRRFTDRTFEKIINVAVVGRLVVNLSVGGVAEEQTANTHTLGIKNSLSINLPGNRMEDSSQEQNSFLLQYRDYYSEEKYASIEVENVVDTFDYFFPKKNIGLIGSHPLDQVIDPTNPNMKYSVKFGEPDNYEMHERIGDTVYLRRDNGGNPGYTFSNGIWLKEHMEIGKKYVAEGNRIQRFNKDGNVVKDDSYEYIISLVARIPNFNVGGKIGIQDTMIIKYLYEEGGPFEYFYYSKGYGWVQWELYSEDGTMLTRTTFYEHSDSITLPQPLTSS